MKNILLVDDDKVVREVITRILDQHFPSLVKVYHAVDGLDAIRMAEKQKFDCVVYDLKMPRLDGNNLLKMMTTLPVELKPANILILSAFATEAQSKRKIANVSYIDKPFKEEDVVSFFKNQVLGKGEKTKFKMDVHFINPFIDATIEVLKVTADTIITKDSVLIKEQDEVSGDISAIVAMNSSRFIGSFAISFEKASFLEVASKMLYEEFTEINNDNRDAIGEICNQVFGMTKAKMNDEMNLDIAKALPSVIVGEKHTIKHQVNGPTLTVKFKTSKGSFTIEVVLQSL